MLREWQARWLAAVLPLPCALRQWRTAGHSVCRFPWPEAGFPTPRSVQTLILAHSRSLQGVFPNTHMECGLSTAQGLFAPLVCGVGFGGGSASAVVDVCVATHMRGLVPHDRVCEMRSGADLWRRAWPREGCSQRSLGSLLASVRRCALLAEPLRGGGYSIVASAQQCPASSRATATTTIKRGLPRASSAFQRPCSLRALAVGLGSHGEGLAGASAFQRDAQPRGAALMPGSFDQKPASVRVAGLGDPALTAALPA